MIDDGRINSIQRIGVSDSDICEEVGRILTRNGWEEIEHGTQSDKDDNFVFMVSCREKKT